MIGNKLSNCRKYCKYSTCCQRKEMCYCVHLFCALRLLSLILGYLFTQCPDFLCILQANSQNNSFEDERSIGQHIDHMKQEARKKQPNMSVIKDKMERTLKYREQYCSSHSTADVLAEFPALRMFVFVSNVIFIPISSCVCTFLH